MQLTTKSYKWVYHVLVWLFLFALPFYFNRNSENFVTKEFLVSWINQILYFIIVFYVFFYYINPRFLHRSKIFRYFLIFFGALILLSLAKMLLYIPSVWLFDLDVRKFEFRFIDGFTSGLLLAGLAVFINFTNNWFRSQQLKTEMEKQKMESELKMLKYQVNPHFLFNTLNNIYSLVLKKSDIAPEAVLKLSSLMRYMIYETNEQRVPLKKELEYIVHFIELQQMRMKYPENVHYTITGDPGHKRIAPMLLIPFIENAFKHSLRSADSVIKIKIYINEGTIGMSMSNKVNPDAEKNSDKLSGIGLANVKKRLKLDYPKKHRLSMYQQEAIFYVDLIMNIDE